MRFLLPLLLFAAPLAAEEFVPRLPVEARLFLRVPPDAAPLKDIQVSTGEWSRGDFEPTPEKRERLTDVRFPVTWWRWREVTLRFTPRPRWRTRARPQRPLGRGPPRRAAPAGDPLGRRHSGRRRAF